MSCWLSTLKFLNTLNELIFLLVVNPTFEPTLCYIASINNYQEPRTRRTMHWGKYWYRLELCK